MKIQRYKTDSKKRRELQHKLADNGGVVLPNIQPVIQRRVVGLRNMIDYSYITQGNAVYLMECNGLYKIGFSNDVKARLQDVQISNPYTVTLEHVIYANNHAELEYELHQIFKHKNIRGEWFSLTSSDVSSIKAL